MYRTALAAGDFVLEEQLAPLEIGDADSVGRGAGRLFPQLLFKCLMATFQLGNMRLHGHGQYLLSSDANVISLSRERGAVDERMCCTAARSLTVSGAGGCGGPQGRRYSCPTSAVPGMSRVRVGRLTQMTAEEERELLAVLERLRQEHRDLDVAIQALQDMPGSDQLQLARFKKRKLQLRDRIGYIEDQICPDIIA